MMDLVESMFNSIAEKLLGTTKISYQGQDIDLTPGWKKITMIYKYSDDTGYLTIYCNPFLYSPYKYIYPPFDSFCSICRTKKSTIKIAYGVFFYVNFW